MKAWPVIGLLFMAAIFATIPISPQATARGVELRVDQAQAQNIHGRYRRVTRRAYRAAPGYYYYGWVPNYGPPVGTYPRCLLPAVLPLFRPRCSPLGRLLFRRFLFCILTAPVG
jgi:hypothetical protein